ncbi:MAG: thiamine pyrophosphate-dependent enzyme, partial [Pseudomonadota bacterium]|nr:thiamine pyrophosphate-dependent enzyme [Pseudomonadota bacterium]
MAALASKNWSANRASLIKKIESEGSGEPINPDWLMLQISEALPDNGIIVNEGVTASRYLNDIHPYRERHDFHGLASGGIGWGIAAAVGVQLAHPDRPVCAIIGDGSSMYSIQAIWSAANQNLPMTYVIVNNGGYRIIKQRLKSFHQNDHFIGMDFKDPEVNFSALAQSMGVTAERVTDSTKLRAALDNALANKSGPNLIEVICEGSV